MPIYLTESDVDATLAMADALRLLESAARRIADGDAMNAPRTRVRAGGAMLQTLSAALDGRVGHKSYTSGPRGAKFWFTLYAPSGEMLAIIEADRLGQIRTGAASGLATKFMARKNAATLGVIGTGYQARTQVEAVCAVRAIESVRVWGRDPKRLERFCAEITATLGHPATAVSDGNAAVSGADIVITMTSADQPVFAASALSPGTHINAAGSNRPTASEIDTATVARAAIVAVEDIAQAQIESGDLREAAAAGRFDWKNAVRLADIVRGSTPGRRSDDEVTLFESLGVGIWDLAVASHVYDACRARGRGTALSFEG